MPMPKEKDRFKSQLARARGLGSAHHGTGHWIALNLTSLANVPLVLWLVWSIVSLKNAAYSEFVEWLSCPVNATLMILVIVSVTYHAKLGTQMIAEDYIPKKPLRRAVLTVLKLLFFAVAVVCIFSVLKIAIAA